MCETHPGAICRNEICFIKKILTLHDILEQFIVAGKIQTKFQVEFEESVIEGHESLVKGSLKYTLCSF